AERRGNFCRRPFLVFKKDKRCTQFKRQCCNCRLNGCNLLVPYSLMGCRFSSSGLVGIVAAGFSPGAQRDGRAVPPPAQPVLGLVGSYGETPRGELRPLSI